MQLTDSTVNREDECVLGSVEMDSPQYTCEEFNMNHLSQNKRTTMHGQSAPCMSQLLQTPFMVLINTNIYNDKLWYFKKVMNEHEIQHSITTSK